MLGFGFVELLLQISIIQAKFMGEKYDLESSQVKRVVKQAQQAQRRKIQGTFCGPNEDQNASLKKHQDRSGQSPPRAATTAHGGWRTIVPGWVHGCAPSSAAQFFVFFVSFRFPAGFFCFQ